MLHAEKWEGLGPPIFLRVTLKMREWPGDEAMSSYYIVIKTLARFSMFHNVVNLLPRKTSVGRPAWLQGYSYIHTMHVSIRLLQLVTSACIIMNVTTHDIVFIYMTWYGIEYLASGYFLLLNVHKYSMHPINIMCACIIIL